MDRTIGWMLIWTLFHSFTNGDTTIAPGDWPHHARDPQGTRYSPLDQITKSNIDRLKPAWTYRTGDLEETNNVFECTPLVIDGVMYLITPFSRAIALDAATGKELWTHDPEFDYQRSGLLASRGVAYWADGAKKRIFLPVRDGRLLSLDAATGKIDSTFGEQGTVNLRTRLAPGGAHLFLSSPPIVYRDLVIQGCGMPDGANPKTSHVPVIALNAATGETAWTFNTIPQQGEFGTDTWANESWRDRGAGNVWSTMSVDPERGIVYLPTTAPYFDFYGGDRHGDNLFCNSIVALDAATGQRIWHFQTVHHDIWDYDLPAHPNLAELTIDGRSVPAVAQIGKTGFVYLFHRVTGEPIFPIVERPTPPSDVPGEKTSPTQPFPSRPPAFTTQGLTEENLSRIDEETYQYLLKQFRTMRSEGLFTPPSEQGSIVFPGFHGGGNWSGAAVDPEGMMYVNSTELACFTHVKPDPDSPIGFKHSGWHRFRDQNGYPGNAPPWGQLSKIDLNRGEIVWQKPLGEFEELTRRGIPPTGQENFGGATVTAGGLVFIASTPDEMFRAFDAETGGLLFQTKLPAAGYAAPVSYLGKDGKQYIAICAGGGGKIDTQDGDYVAAFCLQ